MKTNNIQESKVLSFNVLACSRVGSILCGNLFVRVFADKSIVPEHTFFPSTNQYEVDTFIGAIPRVKNYKNLRLVPCK